MEPGLVRMESMVILWESCSPQVHPQFTVLHKFYLHKLAYKDLTVPQFSLALTGWTQRAHREADLESKKRSEGLITGLSAQNAEPNALGSRNSAASAELPSLTGHLPNPDLLLPLLHNGTHL